MDKSLTKILVDSIGIKQARYVAIDRWNADDLDGIIRECVTKLGFPMFVKPCASGSSIGITKASDEESLRRGDDCHTTRKSLLNVPGDVRQALADADQIAIWFRDLLGPLGITSIDSDPELDATSLARLKAFAPALSADMNANFTRKVV
jgi:hypothetical protein